MMFMLQQQLSPFERFVVEQFGNLDRRLGNLELKVGNLEVKVGNLENSMDHVLGELKVLTEEKTVAAYRSRRMETWIQKAGKKINFPYTP